MVTINDTLRTSRAPSNNSVVVLTKDGDGFAIDDELAVLGLSGSLESCVHGVVLENVDLDEN